MAAGGGATGGRTTGGLTVNAVTRRTCGLAIELSVLRATLQGATRALYAYRVALLRSGVSGTGFGRLVYAGLQILPQRTGSFIARARQSSSSSFALEASAVQAPTYGCYGNT